MFEFLYTDMLDQMFDMYDENLRFLSQFADIREEVSLLSDAFIEQHDAMMASAAGVLPYNPVIIQRMMDVADRIMYLVHKKGGLT